MKLSIVIPTYNRHEKLFKTINELVKQLHELSAEILIIDNESSPPVEEYFEQHNFNFSDFPIRIQRNNGNIGIGANILLAHIQSRTEWTWLLGDDDLPLDDSINIILNDISKVKKDVFLIKYNSTAGKWPDQEQHISNEQEFVHFCDNIRYYSNILFISNSVFRTKNFQINAQKMMNFSQSMCPWILGYILNLENGNSILIKTGHIIKHGIADKTDSWDYHNLREGLSYYAHLIGHELFKRVMLSNLLLFYFDAKKRFALRMFTYPFRYKQYPKEYWKSFYFRLALCFYGRKRVYLFLLAYLIPICYDLSFVNKIMKQKIRENIVQDNGRS
ncbi:MAG: glycosyltransferase involved in cell wall biosynthesis [Cyclobacteriaceae bacterium]|jgi:glycosyltransferase involved in cell wall biosynthesis